MKNKKIVVIGGGTGVFTVLSGLKKYPVDLSAIVTMADNGGSTRILREEFGILPPGDIRRALVALARSEKMLASLFNYRFKKGGGLAGHNFGNLLITALERIKGDFEKAIDEAGKILNIKGEVIPVTLKNTNLYALLENGKIIEGEANIDVPKHNPYLKIKKVYLKPQAKANKRAKSAILKADLIVIGPGDLYTSIIPNLLVRGIPQALRQSSAKKVYVCNLMTKLGETHDFTYLDFVKQIERYLGRKVLDYVIFNSKRPLTSRIAKYEKEGAIFVKYDKKNFPHGRCKVIEGNFLREKGFIRHDSAKLTKTILQIVNQS
ncbi:YvcK family protein [Patescibacteria group bacterium]|nr:YvcK family protein [Patescibacteria group bacterium]